MSAGVAAELVRAQGSAGALRHGRQSTHAWRRPAGRRTAAVPQLGAIGQAMHGSVLVSWTASLLTCRRRGLSVAVTASESDITPAPSWIDKLDSLASGRDPAPNRMRNRPSKSRAKRSALQSHDMAAKLSALTENQLVLLEQMLDDDIIQAVRISSQINGKNQGRRRQEQLVGKMLREYPGPGLDQLEASIDAALSGASLSPEHAQLENTALAWREALLDGDKDVEATLCELAVKMGLDTQQLRTCITNSRKEAMAAARTLAAAEESAENAPIKRSQKVKLPTKNRKALLKFLRELASFQESC